jgi:hypothetical protein
LPDPPQGLPKKIDLQLLLADLALKLADPLAHRARIDRRRRSRNPDLARPARRP